MKPVSINKLFNFGQLALLAIAALCVFATACVAHFKWQQLGVSIVFTLITLLLYPAIKQVYHEYKMED